jgi:hypothetical protein
MDYLVAHTKEIGEVIAATIAFASAIANIFPKATTFGKIVHFLALNFKVHA